MLKFLSTPQTMLTNVKNCSINIFSVEEDSNILYFIIYFISIKKQNEIGPSPNLFHNLKMEPNEHDKMKENCEMNRTTGVEKQAVENSLLGHKD